ncbi:MAG: cytochrome C [Myxococcota bacterium]
MQPDSPLRHSKHVFRILLLLVVAVIAIFFGRALFVPATYGQFGAYRAANVAEQRDKPVKHGNDVSCQLCHASQFATHEQGAHARVRCEVCHAPVVLHAVDGKKTAVMPTHKFKELCLRCHRGLSARPKDFPQIQPRQHVEDNGGTWSDEVCIECHQPHSPR